MCTRQTKYMPLALFSFFCYNYKGLLLVKKGEIKLSKIKMFSLGGLDENGKNMFVIEIDKNIFVFEAGLKYADEMTLGIDYIIPNISYLKENKKRIKGIFLTHAHDENIGALSDIVPELGDVPVYASKYTIDVVRKEFETYHISTNNLKEIKAYIPISVLYWPFIIGSITKSDA